MTLSQSRSNWKPFVFLVKLLKVIIRNTITRVSAKLHFERLASSLYQLFAGCYKRAYKMLENFIDTGSGVSTIYNKSNPSNAI